MATHTVERAGKQSIPIFDTREVVDLLGRPGLLDYLAQMLASFTRIQSYVKVVRVRKGIRRRIRHNDMDIDSLVRLCATASEEHRLSLYKRIADVCLFISAVFPDHAYRDHRHAASGAAQSQSPLRVRRSLEDYEMEGRRFYSLAEEHPAARVLELSDVFGLLRHHFVSARKPLSFIAARYMHSHEGKLFAFRAD